MTDPIPMILHCPECRARHVDEGEFATKPHHTHACQGCGLVWRPAVVPTVGVQFLPGFKNERAERFDRSRTKVAGQYADTFRRLAGDDSATEDASAEREVTFKKAAKKKKPRKH